MTSSIANEISTEELLRHARSIAQWVRLSGTPEEAKAFDYIHQQMESFGFTVSRYESDALIGYPGESTLEVLGDEPRIIPSNGYSLSPRTDNNGVTADLIYVGNGYAQDYAAYDVRGKIVLSDGLATPDKTLAAQQHGAIGQIHLNSDHIYEMCISPVWGTATPETASLLPTVPSVAVTHDDGEWLKQLLTSQVVRIRLMTQPHREWCSIPTLIADIPGELEDRFVLFSGHVDSWHYGAMDNGAANATQLEVARLVAERRDEMRRGLRLAFWSGHSHGRYAGSAWYADTFWNELHEHCVCHVNVDSVGAIGAEVLEEAPVMAETFELARDILYRVAGVSLDYRRISRSSDQSFWGHGIPSLFGTLSEQARDTSATNEAHARLLGSGGRGGGLGWWWHTPEDTLDKLDPENLTRDASIYAEAVWRLLTAERLPFNLAAAADEFGDTLDRYHEAGQGTFDLTKTVILARNLADVLRTLPMDRCDSQEINKVIVDVNRILIPVNYTESGPFHHDLAVGTRPLPGLAGMMLLAHMDSAGDDAHFLHAKLVREQNRVEHALRAALKRLEKFNQS